MKKHRLRRLFGACLGALALMATPVAKADHASPTFNEYFNHPQGPIVLFGDTFCLAGSILDNTTSTQEGYIRTRMENVFDHTVDNTQMDYNFNVESSGECNNNLDVVSTWNDATGSTVSARMNDWCADRGGGESRVLFGPLDALELHSDPIAVTFACDTNLNGFLDTSYVVFSSSSCSGQGGCDFGETWMDLYKYDGQPTAQQPVHWRGVFQHEFIHAIGWFTTSGNGHLVGTGDACDSSGPENTMCPNSNELFINTDAGASIEGHDIGEINENY